MKGLDYTALVLTIIGAINWGLVGLFKFDLVAFLFGNLSWFSRLVYILVGLSGLYLCTFSAVSPTTTRNMQTDSKRGSPSWQPSFDLLQFYKAMMISS